MRFENLQIYNVDSHSPARRNVGNGSTGTVYILLEYECCNIKMYTILSRAMQMNVRCIVNISRTTVTS